MSKKEKLLGRIRYVKDWNNEGEHYIFETRWENEDEWTFSCAAPLCEWKDGEIKTGSGDYLHYTALTQLREWAKIGITDICWG